MLDKLIFTRGSDRGHNTLIGTYIIGIDNGMLIIIDYF